MAKVIKELQCVSEVFYRLNVGAEISLTQLSDAFSEILNYQNQNIRDVLMGGFLTSIMVRKPSVKEVVTLLNTAFKLDSYSINDAIKIDLPKGKKLIGTVGSGKKGVKTMNISTPSAIIATSLGAYIAKTGSSSTSSVTGSADFMQEVGLKHTSNEEMITTLQKTGFGFFSIENLIPNFDKIYGGRFYAPHALSFGLAALVTPIKFDDILFGLAHPDVEFAVKLLKEYKIKNAMIVSSTHDNIHFLDEIGIFGDTKLIGMLNGKIGRLRFFYPTEQLGLPKYSPKHIAQGENVYVNVKYSVDVLKGKGKKAHEDIICINAANLLYLSHLTENLVEGFHKAKDAVKKGLPFQKLEEMLCVSGSDLKKLNTYK